MNATSSLRCTQNRATSSVMPELPEPIMARLSLPIELAAVGEIGSSEWRSFKTAFKADIAAVLGISQSWITVTNVVAGSVLVDFVIQPVSGAVFTASNLSGSDPSSALPMPSLAALPLLGMPHHISWASINHLNESFTSESAWQGKYLCWAGEFTFDRCCRGALGALSAGVHRHGERLHAIILTACHNHAGDPTCWDSDGQFTHRMCCIEPVDCVGSW